MEKWEDLLTKFSSPILRLEKYMLRKGMIKESDAKQYRDEAKKQVKDALKSAIGSKKP